MSDTPNRSRGPFELRGPDGPMSWEKAIFNADGDELLAYYKSGYDDRVNLYDGDWHLFAAAPEMLEVLQELDECAVYWSEYDVPLGIHDRIKAAIAKAEGRQE